jgi:hypothetical protein
LSHLFSVAGIADRYFVDAVIEFHIDCLRCPLATIAPAVIADIPQASRARLAKFLFVLIAMSAIATPLAVERLFAIPASLSVIPARAQLLSAVIV